MTRLRGKAQVVVGVVAIALFWFVAYPVLRAGDQGMIPPEIAEYATPWLYVGIGLAALIIGIGLSRWRRDARANRRKRTNDKGEHDSK